MTTWWVRPDATHSAVRDGTSYETAWGGWSEILWGTPSGVRGLTADTLMVCGVHLVSNISVGAHGAANLAQRVTIRGDYTPDPGAIILSGSAYMTMSRSFTELLNFEILGGTASSVVYMLGSTFQGVRWKGVKIHRPFGGGSGLVFAGDNNNNYTDVDIEDCQFSGDYLNGTNSTGCISWLVSATNALSTMTRISVKRNYFVDADTGRSIVHFRTEDDTSTSTRMEDMVLEANWFVRCRGLPMELSHGHKQFGIGAGLRVRRNRIRQCYQDAANIGFGGVSLRGFTSSARLGRPEYAYNDIDGLQGPAGGVNVFFGRYDIHHNKIRNISTTTIDGNGILFDHGCQDSRVWANLIEDCPGRPGVANSGCGLMILDSIGVKGWGNIVRRCKQGVFYGSKTHPDTGNVDYQSSDLFNNTFVECQEVGVRLLVSASPNLNTFRNNLIVGAAGAGASVNSLVTWTGESNNRFVGFLVPSGHVYGTGTLTTAPTNVTPDYFPKIGSSLLGVGADLGPVRDFNDRQGRRYIGAVCPAPLRLM